MVLRIWNCLHRIHLNNFIRAKSKRLIPYLTRFEPYFLPMLLQNIGKTVGECTEVLRLIEPKYYESNFAKISDELPLYLQRKDVVKKKRERWKQMCMLSIKRMAQPTLKGLDSMPPC